MKTGTIYCIENKVNGKKYIGMSTELNKRWSNHKSSLSNGTHINDHLQNSWNKYGKENFEFKILEDNIKEENLADREIYWIDFYDTFEGEGYNLTKGGESLNGYIFTEEHRMKISEALTGKTHTEESKRRMSEARIGITYSEETKRKMSESHKGKKLSEEHKRKISETLKGKEFSKETRKKLSEALKGRELSEEHKAKLSKAHKGRVFSEETRKKLSKTRQGEDNPSSKITKEQGLEIYQKYHNNNLNLSYKDLAEEYSVHRETIGGIARCEHWSTKHLK